MPKELAEDLALLVQVDEVSQNAFIIDVLEQAVRGRLADGDFHDKMQALIKRQQATLNRVKTIKVGAP
jgi:hypothetical protein